MNGNLFFSFQFKWIRRVTIVLVLSAIVGVVIFLSTSRPSFFGKVLSVYSFKPEVTATAYDSTLGNATVIWVSGMDEYPSEFGQIWDVYSFKPDVVATAYDSTYGNATIIWVSGMDDEETSSKKTRS